MLIHVICFVDEIARQLNDSNARIIVGLVRMSKVLEDAVALTKRPIRIVYAKTAESELLPSGGIDLYELITTKSELVSYSYLEERYLYLINFSGIDLNSLKTYDKRDTNEVALLPYSR